MKWTDQPEKTGYYWMRWRVKGARSVLFDAVFCVEGARQIAYRGRWAPLTDFTNASFSPLPPPTDELPPPHSR